MYEAIFCYELAKMNIPFKRQHPVPLIHETIKLDVGFRADVIMD
ncbi:MAG: GxxExxY protein, partial [Flavisolibacter sp.]|nr:GxxExxY protein [Flavisolibacter sp.]